MKIIIVIFIILVYYIQLLFILYYSEFCIHAHEFIICNTVGYHISYIVKGIATYDDVSH